MFKRFCVDHHLPLLSSEQVLSYMGTMPRQLGEDCFGRSLLNNKQDVVVKYAPTLFTFQTFILEAKVMKLLGEYPGFQRLIGMCPRKMCIVTKHAGSTLVEYADRLKMKHRFSVVK